MLIYKICSQAEWTHAPIYQGSAKDREDGFIHFSTAEQVPGTLERYYADAKDLLLIAVDATALGEALRYEASRDGALFPHLYAALPLSAVRWAEPIGRTPDGGFVMPPNCR